jgi:hypothetical protein
MFIQPIVVEIYIRIMDFSFPDGRKKSKFIYKRTYKSLLIKN